MDVLWHVLHIASTCTSLGGLAYARFVLLPNLELVPEPQRKVFLAAMIRRFSYIKWSGVVIVAVSGVIQWVQIFPTVVDQRTYILCFALKMVGAIGLFSITFLLALPAAPVQGMQRRRKFWSGLNVLCGLTILIGAALMRQVRLSQPPPTQKNPDVLGARVNRRAIGAG